MNAEKRYYLETMDNIMGKHVITRWCFICGTRIFFNYFWLMHKAIYCEEHCYGLSQICSCTRERNKRLREDARQSWESKHVAIPCCKCISKHAVEMEGLLYDATKEGKFDNAIYEH